MHFYAFHGVMPQETVTGNEFQVSLFLEADLSAATLSDDLDGTINYATLFDLVKEEMMIPSKLLEHLAGRIFRRIEESCPQLSSLEVRVSKLHPPVNGELEKAEITLSQ